VTLADGHAPVEDRASVDLYWLPLGAGQSSWCVQGGGRLYEAFTAARHHRAGQRLFHSALIVRLDGHAHAIEMAPVWAVGGHGGGVVSVGPVGSPSWGRSRLFRYEVRCWRDGVIPDAATAVDSPRRVSTSSAQASDLLQRVESFPTATSGRDEQQAGEMWNSNSLTAWLLALSGHDIESTAPATADRWACTGVVSRTRRCCPHWCRSGVLVRR